MTPADLIVGLLIGLGLAVELLACLGLLVMRGVYDRLHSVGPSVLGALLITAAIWVREGASTIALKATLLTAFLAIASPALTHGIARAARIAERGDWRAAREEGIEVEGR